MNEDQLRAHDPVRTFEWSPADGPSRGLVEALDDHVDADVTTLPPLFDALDPDALDALFEAPAPRSDRSEGSVQFDYLGYRIQIGADGRGRIYD
ncbi:hypothetical protein G9C85_15395 [Halorubellus sp. JP-L1]|uniref:HalOD1 output domain-containing protein n=1 Tax=Halorubellus sp. JP-L1 TaxID=2715753 RepID=UPI00140DE97B|nr:HalOD1 output domain-containing protein [Halorubellus sp. JP-L1]NHN43004.1 hypothetical protein [Halorubellus sp. JP-L1]